MNHRNMDADQVLEQVIEQLRNEHVPPYPREEVGSLVRGKERLEQARSRFFTRRVIMSRLIPAAAVVAVMFGSGIHFWSSTSRPGAGAAFAEVQEAIETSRSVRFQVLNSVDNNDPTVTTVLLQEPGRSRVELPNGELVVEDFEGKERMRVSHRDRTALIEPLYVSDGEKAPGADALRKLRELPGQATRKLGEREVGGRKVVDFSVVVEGEESKLTVDAATKLPVRLEVTHANRVNGKSIREVMTDFVFDASYDDSLFRVVPPKGYTVTRRSRGEANPQDAETLIVSPETGIGPVKFGMSTEDIVRALGKPDWQKEHRFANNKQPQPELGAKDVTKAEYIMVELGYDSRGFRLSTSNRNGLHGIECFDRGAMGSSVRDFVGKTRDGIKLGASMADVIKAYGEPQAKLGTSTLMYPKLGWDFSFRGDRLVSIRAVRPNPALEAEVQKDGSVRIRVGK